MQRRSRRKRKTGFKLIAFIVLFLFGAVAYNRYTLMAESREKKRELAQLQEQYAREQERTKELEDEKAYRQTQKYIEELAREKLGLVYEDEIIFEEEKENSD